MEKEALARLCCGPLSEPLTCLDFAALTFPRGGMKGCQTQDHVQLSSSSAVSLDDLSAAAMPVRDRLCFYRTCICAGLTPHLTPTVHFGFLRLVRCKGQTSLYPCPTHAMSPEAPASRQ